MPEEPVLRDLWPGPHLLSASPLISVPRAWITFNGHSGQFQDSASFLLHFSANIIPQKDSL